MPLVELKGQGEICQLQNRLHQSNAPIESLPLQHLVWYMQKTIIQNGHVYVDQWPAYRYLCCLHTCKQFVKNSNADFDFDIATFYCVDHDSEGLEGFLHSLATDREWKCGRSLYVNYIKVPSCLDVLKKVLHDHGQLDVYGTLMIYTGLERNNTKKYRHRLDELVNLLPNELRVDILTELDVDKVTKGWSFAPSAVIPDFFAWLLKTFPSTCLRNGNGEPVAWACAYGCGAMANVHIDPEYRGRGLSEYLWLSIGLRLSDFSPLQPYFSITPGNVVSERSAKKAFHIDLKKGDDLSAWCFFYNRAHMNHTT